MSVLIRGMEMPIGCYSEHDSCPCYQTVHGKWCWCGITKEQLTIGINQKPVSCPLIELPPHGLIDKQMLLQNIADNQFAQSSVGHEEDYAFWGKVWDYIIDAPTIIEAEGVE